MKDLFFVLSLDFYRWMLGVFVVGYVGLWNIFRNS